MTALPTPRWPLPLRIAFRFTFAYFLQFCLCSGHKTILEKVPLLHLEPLANAPYLAASAFFARTLFHLTPPASIPHASAFADRALDYISAALMLALAALATLLWSLLDTHRPNYRTLHLYLRFLLRLTIIVAMLWYGSIKLFPIQIESPSLAVLNAPVGHSSPLTLLWTLLGLNHGYERICGAIETLCALLLLLRRTTLAGALLSAFVLLNILLFDSFFDVPVKLYSAHLLMMSLILIAPDARALYAFFIRHTPAAPLTPAAPSPRSRPARLTLLAAELLFLPIFLHPFINHAQYTRESAGEAHPSPLAGQWHLLSASAPYLTGNGQPLTDLILEPNTRTTIRAADDTLWNGGTYSDSSKTLTLISPLHTLTPYTLTQPDPLHLTLTPLSGCAPCAPTLTFIRVPLPATYPLQQRGLHLVNEWGLER